MVLLSVLCGATGWGHSLLPPDVAGKCHPLARQIESVLQRQTRADRFFDTRLTKRDYLRIVDGQVKMTRTYQSSVGRIADPLTKSEFCSIY